MEEDCKVVEIINRQIQFIDYLFTLPEKELAVFDKIKVRLFSINKEFNDSINTHITFSSSSDINVTSMLQAVDQLITIYDRDDNFDKEVEAFEIDMLEKRDYWPGRTWNFDKQHKLWKIEDPQEKFSYSVTIFYDSYEGGFSMTIFGYNNLLQFREGR